MSQDLEIPAMADAEELPAPCSAETDAGRELLSRPPDWRWQAAVAYTRDTAAGLPATPPSDPVVQYAARALAGQASAMANRFTMRLWPTFSEALALGSASGSSAVTAEVDACLIKGLDHTAAAAYGCPVPAPVYRLYASLFMDLSGIRAVHSWVQDFLFAPEMGRSDSVALRARMLAYYGGGMAGAHTAVAGMMSPAEGDLMRSLMANERLKRLFDYVVRVTRMPPDLYAQLMEGALKDMTGREFQERMRTMDQTSDESLAELAHDMEQGIRAYTQRELESPDPHGLDFSNQYIKALSGADNATSV